MKILLYILILGIVLCTFASSDKVLEHDLAVRNIIWSVLTLVMFLIVSCRTSVKSIEGHTFITSPILVVYLGFLLVTVISLTRAINVTEGYPEVGRVLVSLVFLYVILTIEDKDKLIKSLIILALVIGIYGVYEYFAIAHHLRKGFMSNRNPWSAAQMLLLPFCLSGLSFSKKWKSICLVAGILLLFNIVTLTTRSVWVSLIMASVVTMVVFRNRLNKQKVIILTVFIVLFALITFYLCCDFKFGKKFKNLVSADSLSMRFVAWGRTLEMVRDNPRGVGAGNWKINIAKYGNEFWGFANGQNVRSERFILRPHNDPVWALAETGPVGLGLYVTIFVMSLYYARNNAAMFFGILLYMGFAFFSFPKERVFHSIILNIMQAKVIPVKKAIYLRPQWAYLGGVMVSVLLLMTTALYIVKFKTEKMVSNVVSTRYKDWQKVINIIDGGYSRLSTIDPILATPIIFYRAEAYLYLGNIHQAFEDFKRACQLNPYHIYVLENLGSCYALKGNTEKATECYEKVLAITPSFEAAKNNLEYLRRKEL